MKQLTFTLKLTCTEEQFQDEKVQQMIAFLGESDFIADVENAGFTDVSANWDIKDKEE